LFSDLRSEEFLTLNLTAEDSQFIRWNRSRVRQIGTVRDAQLEASFVLSSSSGERREAQGALTLTGDFESDLAAAREELARLRAEAPGLPVNPFLPAVSNHGTSEQLVSGRLLEPAKAVPELLRALGGASLSGIYASGPMIRANANSLGQRHWFESERFTFDYSVDAGGPSAVKGEYAGAVWDTDAFAKRVAEAASLAESLRLPAREIRPGSHRVYLAPAALADIVLMLNWGGIGEAALRQGDSPLRKLREKSAALSPLFTLEEDFRAGNTPRFNPDGELAPERLSLIHRGKLENTLVSALSAAEYAIPANGAGRSEAMRAPVIAGGSLARSQVLERLGTGLYLSNLHYLNWSDQPGGRITGMTRHACFFVEDAKIIAPIQDLRWDDSIFQLLGERLEALSAEVETLPATGSYGFRDLGATVAPGALISAMEFTL
jgi:predicted Zn-dependent protease